MRNKALEALIVLAQEKFQEIHTSTLTWFETNLGYTRKPAPTFGRLLSIICPPTDYMPLP